jgi:hypothetical protein
MTVEYKTYKQLFSASSDKQIIEEIALTLRFLGVKKHVSLRSRLSKMLCGPNAHVEECTICHKDKPSLGMIEVDEYMLCSECFERCAADERKPVEVDYIALEKKAGGGGVITAARMKALKQAEYDELPMHLKWKFKDPSKPYKFNNLDLAAKEFLTKTVK